MVPRFSFGQNVAPHVQHPPGAHSVQTLRSLLHLRLIVHFVHMAQVTPLCSYTNLVLLFAASMTICAQVHKS
jgi:hypothetical protein